ncbi:probable cytochrome P450 6a17, partial [Cimex lectularius]|uniref:Cytochrome P450 n=1 Tax=Cimex lectularius TaxID=79782 RepID=A0A8I6TL62_CIMLE
RLNLYVLSGITEGELVGHVFSFFVAGHDTTATTAAFAFYELSKNKEIQDKLWQEVAGAAKENEGLTYEAVKNIPYLNHVIQETMRMYPILGILKRVCTRPYKLEDFEIPLGMEVIIPVRSLHYDPRYFEEPRKFKPERFADGKPPEIYMPF